MESKAAITHEDPTTGHKDVGQDLGLAAACVWRSQRAMEDDDLAEPLLSRSKRASFAQQDEDTAHGLFNDAEAQAVEEAALLLCMESLWNGEVPTKDIRFSAAADMAAARQQLDCVLSRIRPSTEPASLNLLRARLQPRCADTGASLSGLLDCINSEIESLPHLAQVLARQVFVAERLRTAAGDSSHDDDDSAATQQAADIHEDDLMPVLLHASTACCAAIEQQQPSLHDVGALLAAGQFDDTDSDDECASDAPAASHYSLRRLRVTVQSLAGSTTFEEEEDYNALSDDDSDPLELDSFDAAFAEASSDAPPATATAAVHAADDEAAAVAAVRQLVRSLREAVRSADPVLPTAAATAAAVHMATAAVACARSAAAAADAAVRTALGPLSARLRVTTNCPDARKLCPVAVVRVGVRQWGAAHYGLGFAVETQARVRVGLAVAADTATAAAAAAAGEEVQWWSGSVVCDVCQAFALRDGADCAELEQTIITSSSSSSSAAAGEADVFYDAAEAVTAADSAVTAAASEQQQSCTEPCAGYVCLRLRPEELVLRSPTELSDVSDHVSSDAAPSATIAATAAAGVQLVPGCLRDSDKRRTAGGGATELLGFGANEFGCLGLPRAAVRVAPRPRSLPLRGLLPSERVLCVACSSRHTVLVTSLGAVFTAGDASSGALGHGPPTAATTAASSSAGDSSSSDRLRRVDWFSDAAPQPLLVAAAAGSDLLGCHSMALCSEGRVYAWGLGAATGTGTARTVWLPALVQMPKQQQESVAVVAVAAPAATTTAAAAAEAVDDSSKVTAIACGCAFSLALTASGAVYSWGAIAWGRLGCGLPQPIGTATAAGAAAAGSRSRGTGRTRVQRFQLRPRCVVGLPQRSPAVAIAAGGWHGLALTASGSVYSWGRNSSGQLGRGPLTADGWWPGRVTSFDTATTSNSTTSSVVLVRAIAAGAAHSAAVDATGTAWTWGGGGGALLGHGELSARPTLRDDDSSSSSQAAAALSSGSSTAQQQQQLLLRPKRMEDSEPVRAARAAAQGWDKPRPVAALQGVQLRAAACGAAHTAFVTVDSRLYLCGEGPCLATAAAADDYDATAATATTATASTAGDDSSSVVLMAPPVPVPREPCAVFLPALAGRCVGAVACGGAHTLVLTAGQSICGSLGRVLLAAAEARASGSYYSDDAAAYADSTSNSSSNSSPTAPDTLLIVGGTYLHAHRCILARRSPVLRELIAAEERPDGASLAGISTTANSTGTAAAVAPLQLLLPDLRPEVARALREFLYTDALAHPLDPAAPLVHDLLAAAKAYQVTRLAAICSAAIAPPYYEQLLRKQTAKSASASSGSKDFNLVTLPPSTLAADLGGALGESEHADVRFLAGGRPIYAHRAVLCARSEYFAAMFSSGMAESSNSSTSGSKRQQQQQQRCVDVVVPDSHVGMLRLLLFLYSGTLPPAAPDTLLEDLLSADRYRLLNMVSNAVMQFYVCIYTTRWCTVSVVIANTV
jgi:alpha-tubulin suppressor-like RCC1 family protein